MQPENKNDSVQLSTRYQQYNFAKRHLGGTSRPEVFPIGEANGEFVERPKGGEKISSARYNLRPEERQANDSRRNTRKHPSFAKDIIQLNQPKHSNDRVYGVEGVSPTLNTMQGENRQPFIRNPYNGKQSESETGTLGTSCGTTTGKTAQLLHKDAKIRRLTPTECERLQGFPEIEKYAILEVCKQVNANGVEITLNTKVIDQDSAVQPDVLIDCVENGVEIHSQGRLLLNAKNAEKKTWSHPPIKIDDFVQLLVGINIIKEKVIRRGEEESHQNEQSLTLQKNGEMLEKLYGNEIMQPVGDVKNDLITFNELLKLTTLNHSNTENLEQKLQTLSLFVIRAINGFIPKEILNQDTFTVGIRTRVGYTYGVSDTQRYKTLGNAISVPVVKAIVEKLLL